VAGDDDGGVARRLPEQPQRGQVVPDRVGRAVQVEERYQHVRQHVTGYQDPGLLDQQGGVTGGVGLVLDDADGRAAPGDAPGAGGQAGDRAEQVERDLIGDVGRYQPGGDAGLGPGVRQPVAGERGAAGGAIAGRRTEPAGPQQVIPVRVGGEARHHRGARGRQVTGQADQLGDRDAGVDEQRAGRPLDDHGVALAEGALMDQHTVGHRGQHEGSFRCGWPRP